MFVHLKRHGFLRPFADLFHAARRLSLLGWLCVAPLVVGLVGYASTKNDGGCANGSRLNISKVGVDEKLIQTGGHRFPTKEVRIPADSDVNYEFVFEGKAESESEKDIKVTASLTAINAMSPQPETAELTAVRVAIRPDHSTGPMYRNRHLFGVCEQVYCESWPQSISVGWSGGTAGRTRSNAASFLHEVPFAAQTYSLVAKAEGVEFPCSVESIFPDSVKAFNDPSRGVTMLRDPSVTGAGGVGMQLPVYRSPTNVYFGEIQVRELEAVGVAANYFASPAWTGGRDHRGTALSDEWLMPDGPNNQFGEDKAYLPVCPTPWGVGGSLTWNIPNSCRAVVDGEFRTHIYSHSLQVFTISSCGVVEVTKFGYHVGRNPGQGQLPCMWRDGNADD